MGTNVTDDPPVAPVSEVVVYPISEGTHQRTTMDLDVVYGSGGE